MYVYAFRALVAPLMLLGLAWSSPAAQPLPKAEVVKRGKAATALLQIQGSGPTQSPGRLAPRYSAHATAFCVHPSGLFLTSNHVLQQMGENPEITLVLDTGLRTQRALKAKVARADQALDLALL